MFKCSPIGSQNTTRNCLICVLKRNINHEVDHCRQQSFQIWGNVFMVEPWKKIKKEETLTLTIYKLYIIKQFKMSSVLWKMLWKPFCWFCYFFIPFSLLSCFLKSVCHVCNNHNIFLVASQGIVGNLSSGKSALVHRYLTGTYVQEESPEGKSLQKEVRVTRRFAYLTESKETETRLLNNAALWHLLLQLSEV